MDKKFSEKNDSQDDHVDAQLKFFKGLTGNDLHTSNCVFALFASMQTDATVVFRKDFLPLLRSQPATVRTPSKAVCCACE